MTRWALAWHCSAVKVQTQIAEGRILRLDQCEFFLAPPGFDLFFAANRVAYVSEWFEVDQSSYAVSLCESWKQLFFVLRCPAFQVIRDSYIEDARRTGQDVDVINQDGRDFVTSEAALSFREERGIRGSPSGVGRVGIEPGSLSPEGLRDGGDARPARRGVLIDEGDTIHLATIPRRFELLGMTERR